METTADGWTDVTAISFGFLAYFDCGSQYVTVSQQSLLQVYTFDWMTRNNAHE